MEQIKDTLSQLLARIREKKEEVEQDNPEQLLEKIFAKKDLRHIRLHNVQKGVLYLQVDTTVMLYYVKMQKAELLSKIGQAGSLIKDIHFSLNPDIHKTASEKRKTYERHNRQNYGRTG
jgi:hypothetical protein